MAIRRILVPIDGSTNSFRGLNMAVTVAQTSGAAITLVHSMYVPTNSEFKGTGTISDKNKAEIKKFMEKAEHLLDKNNVAHDSKLVSGNIGYNILKLAHSKSAKFDMIVIGSRGRGSLKEMFFGSTSNFVIHSSKIPILVVK